MSRLFDKADEIFVAERALSEALSKPSERKAIGPHDLYRFLTENDDALSTRVTPALFQVPRLRTELANLRDKLATVHIPTLAAAASDRSLTERAFPGGVLRIEVLPEDEEVYVMIAVDPPIPEGRLALVGLSSDGKFQRRSLPPFDGAGETLLILGNSPDDQDMLAILEDPTASAALVPVKSNTEV